MEMQGKCLIETLNILKISSKESVENLETFSGFKEYMHVERQVQKELLALIEAASGVDQSQLILVCGSVGDGKSHLLSYLKHHYSELLNGFSLYNDASESFNPEDTDMDTLNRELEAFSDAALGQGNIHKILLAINLGTLSNFIESEYKQRYTKLRDFVYQHKILDSHVSSEQGYQEESAFQYINFSDYHLYTLTGEGPQSTYIKSLLDKLVSKDEDNIFYTAHREGCQTCSYRNQCVVKENYHLMQHESIREGIVQVIIQMMIKEKLIISTREMLNFFNDLLVGGLDQKALLKLNEKNKGLDKVLEQKDFLLPNILFEKVELSSIIGKIASSDPLIKPNKKLENEMVHYQLTDAIISSIRDDLTEFNRMYTTSIAEIVSEATLGGMSHAKLIEVRYEFFKLYKRTKYLIGQDREDETYISYMKDLYNSNKNNLKGLKELYLEVCDTLYKWDGSLEAKGIRVGSSKKHRTLGIYEHLDIKPHKSQADVREESELEKFVTHILLNYTCDRGKTVCALNIDYSLYDLLKKINQGYIPNKEEQNKNVTLQIFIEQLLKSNREHKEAIDDQDLLFEEIEEKEVKRYKLEVNAFGDYEFNKVI